VARAPRANSPKYVYVLASRKFEPTAASQHEDEDKDKEVELRQPMASPNVNRHKQD
jgi:hypothetical protein